MKLVRLAAPFFILTLVPLCRADDLRQLVAQKIAAEYPSLDALYKDLHAHPELSLMETATAAKLAGELRAAGYEVTEKFGGTGVVAMLKNGPGPVLMIRSELDALPVKEETGLAYASTVRVKDLAGNDTAVMHACGHDIHLTSLVGTARTMAALRDRWSGTLIFIGQPAEERFLGARAMLAAGLFQKFPQPDFVVALHDNSLYAAGTVAITPGFTTANADTVEITVRGLGGHGSTPHVTKDPIALAARIVVALQMIVSRETDPREPCVVTVGSIHGGAKANIIPNEVKLQLTLRSYSDKVRAHTIEALQRICRGEAISAGLPEDLMPIVNVIASEGGSAIYNDPALTARVQRALAGALGTAAVLTGQPEMGSEDFSEFGRTAAHVPICMFDLGAVDAAKLAEADRTGVPLPGPHNSKFAPVPEPTIKTGIAAMSAVALDLLAKK